ncbi:MAG: hypothetical protein EOR72_13860 [Mesorhizobium sp.]|uniref:hypothetical protein n=1 Tax=Mesorhizobium sp. TaxID=1871066 RepID=UPI000FE85DE6|nr:hypothetical protein [Mesorhizobium sp.]RWM14960.1 MAG: hypothetical protein EOR72_13860 [Mesorhizobium sp.]
MDAPNSRMRIRELVDGIATMREVGSVGVVGRLLLEAREHPDSEQVVGEIARHEAWYEWATKYEQEHGRDSLLDRQHPVHINAMEIVRSVREAGLMVEAAVG